MTSVINNSGGFYTRQVYLNEIRRMGFNILQPDVTKSLYYYSIEDKKESDGLKKACLRAGLGQIGELSSHFLEKIINICFSVFVF